MNEIQEIGDAFTEVIRWKAVEDLGYSKEKIEQNQKIVDELLHFHSCPIVPSQEGSEGIKRYLNSIVKIATGKDIQEIQSQETVKN